jgi:predicted aldo/keto reductase-like oxidoreductase
VLRGQPRGDGARQGHRLHSYIERIQGSLERLGLDYVNIYYLASVGNPETLLHEPYIRAFEKPKQDGKIRFAGITTHENEPVVIRAAADNGFWDVVLTACNFRQTHREEVRAAIHDAARAGLGITMNICPSEVWSIS